MAAIAQFAYENNLEFQYYTKSVPSWLKETPIGNFKIAIDFNMKYIELRCNEDLFYAVNSVKYAFLSTSAYLFRNKIPSTAHFIERGGASQMAEIGVKQLAQELDDFILHSSDLKGKSVVFVPAGF